MFNGLKQCNHPSSFVLSYASKILNERKIFRVRAENASMPHLSFSWQDQATRTEPNGRWRFPQKKWRRCKKAYADAGDEIMKNKDRLVTQKHIDHPS